MLETNKLKNVKKKHHLVEHKVVVACAPTNNSEQNMCLHFNAFTSSKKIKKMLFIYMIFVF